MREWFIIIIHNNPSNPPFLISISKNDPLLMIHSHQQEVPTISHPVSELLRWRPCTWRRPPGTCMASGRSSTPRRKRFEMLRIPLVWLNYHNYIIYIPEDPKYGLFACIWVCTLSERPTMLFTVWPWFLHAFPTVFFRLISDSFRQNLGA